MVLGVSKINHLILQTPMFTRDGAPFLMIFNLSGYTRSYRPSNSHE